MLQLPQNSIPVPAGTPQLPAVDRACSGAHGLVTRSISKSSPGRGMADGPGLILQQEEEQCGSGPFGLD